MENFELPIAGGNVDNTNHKELVISTYQGNLVRAPYDGVVKNLDINHCDGYVTIEHIINNQPYYSSFCGVNRITVNRGDFLKKGYSLGIAGDKEIKYSILDDGGRKVNLKPFFDGVDSKTDNGKKDDNKKNDNKKDDNKKDDDNTKNLDIKDNGQTQDIFSSVGLLPFNLVDKLLGKNFKGVPLKAESILKDKVLQEELKKIKKLLK